jgi:hypothetical protein
MTEYVNLGPVMRAYLSSTRYELLPRVVLFARIVGR